MESGRSCSPQSPTKSQTWLKPWPITEALPAAPSTAKILANIFQYSAAAASSVVIYTYTHSPTVYFWEHFMGSRMHSMF